ncbi:polycystin-1-like protein 2 isoform X2 [Argopecten irradians]|uniref:polycystin-1-like protein 2 isoform X2 n=1 Tax=Argopecten irradians TaxID=31199 RepID=UPI0037146F9E
MNTLIAKSLPNIYCLVLLIPVLFGHYAYGCPQGTYGPSCENTCPANCAGSECHSETGLCTAGCVPGYFGDSCSSERKSVQRYRRSWFHGRRRGQNTDKSNTDSQSAEDIKGENLVFCEHETISIECPAGEIINIKEAFYGRENDVTCTGPGTTVKTIACSSDVALEKYKEICHDKNSCSLQASNSVTGDPCGGTSKYARVSYTCENPVCSSGTWGADCGQSCAVGCIGGTCNHITGHCSSGCVFGYIGQSCDQKNEVFIEMTTLDVSRERSTTMVVLVQNYDYTQSKVYIQFGTNQPCLLEDHLSYITQSMDIENFYGIICNTTGYSHYIRVNHMFFNETTLIIATLDNLGVISTYNVTVNAIQHPLIEDCYRNATIPNTSTDVLTPVQIERSLIPQFIIDWNLDMDCLTSYGTFAYELVNHDWAVRYHHKEYCWDEGNTRVIETWTPGFDIPPNFLPVGFYIINCRINGFVRINGIQTAYSRNLDGYIEITPNRLVTSLGSVSSSNQLYSEVLVLDATSTTDPDGTLTLSDFQFVWTCVMDEVLPCTIEGVTIDNDNITIPHSDSTYALGTRTLKVNHNFTFEVTVSAAERLDGKAQRHVSVINDVQPEFEFICVSNCQSKLVPGTDWEVYLNQIQDPEFLHPWSSISLSWQLYKGNEAFLMQNSTSLLVDGSLLDIDTVYNIFVEYLVAEITDELDLNGTVQLLNVTTNDLPVVGFCNCTPLRGFSDVTKFSISCTDFYDVDTPLTYKLTSNGIVLQEENSGYFSNVLLPTGFAQTDYYSNITVQVTDSLNGTVAFDFIVQVYPSLAEYKASINQPPVNVSGCEVSPASGIALLTNFSVACSEFTDLDPPITYSLYLEDFLLYRGNKTTTTAFVLGEAFGENSTTSLSFKANDVYHATTTIDILVQVLPFETDEDILEFLQNNFISGETDTSQLSLQTIGTIGNVVNDDSTNNHSTETEKEAAERLELRTEIRESLTETLLSIEIAPSMDDVEQVTTILDSLTKVTEEVSEKQEELTINVYGNLAETLSDSEMTDATEKQSTSKTLLGSMGNILTVINDRSNTIKKINTTTSNQVTEESKQEKLEKVKKNTLKMISTVETIVDVLTETITDEPITVETAVMSVRVQEMPAENDAATNVTVGVMADNSSVGLFLPPTHILTQSTSGGDNSSVYTQIVVMKDNLYNWDATAERVTSPVVDIVLKDKQLQTMTLTNMSDPVTVQFDIGDQNLKSDTLKFIYDTKTGQVVSSSVLKVSLTDLHPEMTLMVYMKAEKLALMVYYNSTDNGTVSPTTVQQDGIPKLLNASDGSGDFLILSGIQKVFLSIAVKEGQVIPGNKTDVGETASNVSVSIGTYSTMCSYYNNVTDKWSSDGCVISPPKDLKTMACNCDHLTAFAAGFIIIPNLVDPIADAALFLTFFDNPVVVVTVVIAWGLYLIMLVWARRKDRIDTMKGGVSVLEDNCAEDKYIYVVGVVTGWWRHAGTTANVYMYLCGDEGYSSKHLLSGGVARHFKTADEDWFVLTTPKSLGDLRSIVIWHDNAGESPAWFLKQIVVRDLQANTIWHFLYNNWLAVDRGVGEIKAELQSLTQKDLVQNSMYQFGLKSSKDLQNNHLWISIISCPAYSPFTRIQRLSCALSLLLTTMLASLMFHGVPTDNPEDQLSAGGISFSLSDIIIGIESGLIMFPVNFIIMQLFTRLDSRPSDRKMSSNYSSDEGKEKLTNSIPNENQVNDSSKAKKKPFRFPWWVIYIAWILVVSTTLISSYFVMLYGLMYGYQASVKWLVSFFTAFFQSAFVTQPLKVFLIAVLLAFIFKKPVEFEVLSQRDNIALEQDEDYCQTELLKRQGITLSTVAPVKQATRPAMPKRTLQALRERLKLEERITTILREMIMYFTFVAIVLIIVHGHQDVATNYGATRNTEDMFVYGEYTKVKLAQVKKVEDMWNYLQSTALPMLYTDTDRMANDVSYLIGTARLRQKRIEKNSSCYRVNTELFTDHFPDLDCKVPFSASDEEWGSFNKSWNQPLSENDGSVSNSWKYQSSWELKTIPFVGRLTSYSGGGYVTELPHDSHDANVTLTNLISQHWVDKYTGVVFLEFTCYNPNVDMLTVAMIVFELSNVGSIMPYYTFFSSKLNHYDSDMGKFVAACESLFVVYLIGFTYFEVKKFRRLRKSEYFTDTWSYFEIIIIALGYSTIGLFVQRLVMVDSVLTDYENNGPDKFTSFYTAVFWDFVLTYVLAALVMVVILKVFKLFRYNTKTTILMQTLASAKGSLINFGFLFFVCFLAFSLFANLAFGYWLEDYRDVGSSIITMTHFLVGVSDYTGLEEAHAVFGPAFFFLFAFIIQYILLSVFVAIILEAQSLSRRTSSNDVALTKFVCERILLMIGFIKRSDYK